VETTVRVHNQVLLEEREKSDLQVNPMGCLKHDLATPNGMIVVHEREQAPGKVGEGNAKRMRKKLRAVVIWNALPLHV
jgi:hypothetical protein